MLSQFAVVYDACVLYPAPLRDLLMHLAMTGLFRAKWTNHIHDEWITNLLENRSDLTLTQLTRTRQLMDTHVLESLVEGYEHRIERLALPDPDDRHVLAAAIESKASLIVTQNVRDFPDEALKPFGIVAITPDDFVLDQIELSAELVVNAIRRHKDSLKNPAFTWDEYFKNLDNHGLTQSVARLKDLIPDWMTGVKQAD